MKRRPPEPGNLAALVDNMFANVLTVDERRELLVHIRAWEEANPDVTPAERVTGWIDVAYAFQAERPPSPLPKEPPGLLAKERT